MPPKASIASQKKNTAGFNAAQMDLPIQKHTTDPDDSNTFLAAQLSEGQATFNTLQTSKLALSNQVPILEAEL